MLLDTDANRFFATDSKWLTADNLYKLVGKMKAGKHDGKAGISSDCLIHGSKKLMLHLAFLFKIMISHGYTPQDLLVGTMIPIPKVKGMAYDSEKISSNNSQQLFGQVIRFNIIISWQRCSKIR